MGHFVCVTRPLGLLLAKIEAGSPRSASFPGFDHGGL